MPWPWHSTKPLKRRSGAHQYLFASGQCRILWIELYCVGGEDAPIQDMLSTGNATRKFNRILRMGAALIRSFSYDSNAKKGIPLGPRRPREILEANKPTPEQVLLSSPPDDVADNAQDATASAAASSDAPLGTDANPIRGWCQGEGRSSK